MPSFCEIFLRTDENATLANEVRTVSWTDYLIAAGGGLSNQHVQIQKSTPVKLFSLL